MKKTVKAKAKKTVTKKKYDVKYGNGKKIIGDEVKEIGFYTDKESLKLANSLRNKNKKFILMTPFDGSIGVHTFCNGKNLIEAYLTLKEKIDDAGFLDRAEAAYQAKNPTILSGKEAVDKLMDLLAKCNPSNPEGITNPKAAN